MVTSFTYKSSLVRIDERNFELLWRQTHKHTQTNPQTGPITIHCTTKLAPSVMMMMMMMMITIKRYQNVNRNLLHSVQSDKNAQHKKLYK